MSTVLGGVRQNEVLAFAFLVANAKTPELTFARPSCSLLLQDWSADNQDIEDMHLHNMVKLNEHFPPES